ncbi:hypothetical protein SAMN05421640_2749 [Ekhidna lutea]|uniref:Uncharacterized protein n=1 Tax=Ekhidna lutea TaxID=447679 RepID=A0A239KKT1_EKHLU|nr:hypothetical protein [Ekhidna lutea]SNT18976.1 hypothetical protein SAMN05421640_2749 [Ekhidna lutea]
MKWIVTFALLLAFYGALGQKTEKQLMDTIDFVTQEIQTLTNSDYAYKAYRLNYDNCNLEIEQAPQGDSTKWDLFAFWFVDIDETKMKVLEQPNGEWGLILNTISEEWKIKYVSETDSGRRNFIIMLSDDREQLIALGQAIYFAIKKCKSMDRVGDY